MDNESKPKVRKNASNPGNMGKGRVKGVPNKATKEFRDTINTLLTNNSDNVALWLSQVASDDPARALDLLAKLAEYAAPKLARTEHVGPNGGAMKMQIEEIKLVPMISK